MIVVEEEESQVVGICAFWMDSPDAFLKEGWRLKDMAKRVCKSTVLRISNSCLYSSTISDKCG